MHPNVSIIVGAAILRLKDALSVATEIVRLPARIDVSHQHCHSDLLVVVVKVILVACCLLAVRKRSGC
jgi:hypothetical protein